VKMYLSAEIGLKLSKSCIRQHASLYRVSLTRAQRLNGKESAAARVSSGRCFATQNPGYSVVSGSSDESILFREQKQLERRKLVLYSKPGCCLCDALKEKMQLAFMLGGDHDLSEVELEVRDITTNEAWEKAYQYEIPVLTRLRADDSEETIPRFSPRLTVEQLQKKLAAALSSKKD